MTLLKAARRPRPARHGRPAAPGCAAHPGTAVPVRGLPPDPVPPAWGWKLPGAGRAAHVTAAPEYQATTTQVCGLYPFMAGSGTPIAGTPVGRHQLWGEVVCLDPLAWLRAGLVTNPGEFILGQPGIGKSTLVKRQITGAVATGTRVLVLGDTKPDYTMLIEHLGGQVIRIGRGLDRINPLDAGPLGAALARMTGPDAARAALGGPLPAAVAADGPVHPGPRERRLGNAEEVILGRAIDLLDERARPAAQPAVPDVLAVIEQGPDILRAAARADTPAAFRDRAADLVFTLDLLCTGSLAGVFDGPTSRPIDLDAPACQRRHQPGRRGRRQAADRRDAVHLELRVRHGRRRRRAGRPEHRPPPLLHGRDGRAVAGAARRTRPGRARRRLTRLNRAKGMSSIMITHSLADLDALATEEDRAKARGFIERSAITVMGRAAAPRTRPGPRDHPADRAGDRNWSPPGPRRTPGSPAPGIPAAENT